MDLTLKDTSTTVVVRPNEVATASIELPCIKPKKEKAKFKCIIELRKLLDTEVEAQLVEEKEKSCLDIPGATVNILVSYVDYKATEEVITKELLKIFGVPQEAKIIACKPLNLRTKVEIINEDTYQVQGPNVSVILCFDLLILLSEDRKERTQIVSRQLCDLYCKALFCVPEVQEGCLVAKGMVVPLEPYCDF
ncbi:hypothetical protein F9B85_12165 [Heliorestis acidaminivorans]|uniref:Uncharacterized protein n=1 Tax=Heliorestis acidaminivorans TaxID=553427 RepID=A0A6I0EUT5_9FIRM|nr:hypothetical protein [Heliorestis acidaminivorans]KAB2951552.1 hypothetical protein F9B85_12165 [Heliorestis acidaminivorans]